MAWTLVLGIYSFAFRGPRVTWGVWGDSFPAICFALSEIMSHLGRKCGPQGVQHGQNVDDFLGDGAADRT